MNNLSITEARRILLEHGLWRELIDGATNQWSYDIPASQGTLAFSGISLDSRTVKRGNLFFCKGAGFKEEYLADALEKGAACYVTEVPRGEKGLALIVGNTNKALALLAAAFYGHPEKTLHTIAVTGTKGKTTTAYFAWHILKSAGKKAALISTEASTVDGEHFVKSRLTTPDAPELNALLRQAVDSGVTHLVLEVSSQAYRVNRIYGLFFDTVIFLNISPDHIGPLEHPTFEDYFYCKRQLLHHGKRIVLNRHSDYFPLLHAEALATGVPVQLFDAEDCGTVTLGIPGDFNRENAAAALAACRIAGIADADCFRGIAATTVPGRMEVFRRKNGGAVYVDYAHNGVSLRHLLDFVRFEHRGRLVVVMGSTGTKGVNRRRDVGQVLSDLADEAVITTDDPGDEDPRIIAAEMAAAASGIPRFVELDRERAIVRALTLAPAPEDVVVVAGKGRDCFQKVGGKDLPYIGDIEAVTNALEAE
jgi:UDP-N-acetylmuramoyl-L-alanyl-D-glutamate-L-lysine ligase